MRFRSRREIFLNECFQGSFLFKLSQMLSEYGALRLFHIPPLIQGLSLQKLIQRKQFDQLLINKEESLYYEISIKYNRMLFYPIFQISESFYMQLSRALVYDTKIRQPMVQLKFSSNWTRTCIKYFSEPFHYTIRNGKYEN